METAHYTLTKVFSVFEPTTAKVISAIFLSVFGFFFSQIYVQGLIGIAMLMVFDTVLGVSAAYQEGQAITSRGFSRAVVKGIVYFTAISSGHFADMTLPVRVIEYTMIGFVGVTEFVSILENVGRMGFRTPQKLLNQLNNRY